jgi:hypothetical protein
MHLSNLSLPLPASSVEFRIQSINDGKYAQLLAYKDARVDINRLNAVCGPLGWKREHSRDNANCTVSIWDEANKHWVSKEDTGTESNTEAAKGLASDSFKRACFNWSIGIELYDYPLISIQLTDDECKKNDRTGKYQATWKLKLKEWKWYSEFNDQRKITFLAAKDTNGNVRFQWGNRGEGSPPDLVPFAEVK